MAYTTCDNDYGTAKLIVDSTAGNGNYTTIAAALTAASSGQTIFIRPGTYTENLTLKAGVNLVAYLGDSVLPNVTIIGKATYTGTGNCSISNIRLQTNSDFLLVCSGSNASILNFENCYFNCTNNTGISFTNSNALSTISLFMCIADTTTTGIAIFASSSAGAIGIGYCTFLNTGLSTTASTISAGVLSVGWTGTGSPITSSGTASVNFLHFQTDTSALNVTALTVGGSGISADKFGNFDSGSASAVSIGASANFVMVQTNIGSSNTNAITGAGVITYAGISFTSTSKKINTTTQVGGVAQGGLTQAPSAGFIGEQLTANASAVATTSTTAKTVTSISLTAGIWDISGSCACIPTGGTAVMNAMVLGISATDNTQPGTAGIDQSQINITASPTLGLIAPLTRVTLATSTTYYLVVTNYYTSTTCPATGKITATRVG